MRLSGFGMRAIGVGTGVLLIVAGAFAIHGGVAGAAAATRFVATSGSDANNDCTDQTNPCLTIQHAVFEADPGDTVSIAAGTYPESVFVAKSLTFVGASRTTVTVTGSGKGAGFTINSRDSQVAVTLQSLAVKNVVDAPGVLARGADLTVEDSDIDDNAISGVFVCDSSMTATDSTFDGNHGMSTVQGVPGGFGIGGDASQVSVTRSSASNNDIGGLATAPSSEICDQSDSPTLNVLRSTVAGNGIVGIGASQVPTTIAISTIANNNGVGVLTVGGTVTLRNSTVSGTTKNANLSAGDQAGVVDIERSELPRAIRMLIGVRVSNIARRPDAAASGFDVVGSIVANNSALPDCIGSVTDEGYNLSSDAANSCGFSSATHSLTQADPKLGPLADNGGPTLTLLPAKHSDAIDVIPNALGGCSPKIPDQRAVARPQGAKCDIGAVEAAQPPVVISPDSLPHGTVGNAYHATVSATGGLGAPYAFSLAASSLPLPPGLTMDGSGVISGTPTKAGTFPITVSVDDPVQKDYTIIIDAPTPPSTSPPASTPPPVTSSSVPPPPAGSSAGTGPIANTGANAGQLTTFGVTALALGLLVLCGALYAGRRAGRRPGRHGVRYYD